MYLRYLAKYYNETNQKEDLGFFYAADYVRDHCNLSVADRKDLESSIHWFNHHLPVPDYYQTEKNRQSSKSATSCFKDSATPFIYSMNEVNKILEKYHISIKRISSKKPLGRKMYEDDFQVTIDPYREVSRKVK